MNDRNETIIDAVIKKADALCPDSLALIGVYGSVATGDEYGKSDLDLMILINDENGQALADGFIIDDVDIGYVVSQNSADELQIVRILAAQIISFVFVLMVHAYRTTTVR